MAVIKWNGGASLTAQVDTFTLNNDFNDSETDITITLTSENGSTTQTVSIDPSGTNESTIAAALQSALAASTDSLFTAIDWTVASNVVTGTAKVAGVPFYAESSVTGGAGSITDATATANSGPNDWNVDGNWQGGSKPSANDDVLINGSTHPILYGLDQSSLSLDSLRIGPTMRANVGDVQAGISLQVDATDLIIESTIARVWVTGTTTRTTVTGCPRGADAVVLGGTHTTLNVIGRSVLGEVRTLGSTAHSTTNVLDVKAGGRVTVGAGAGSGSVLLDGGIVDWDGGGMSSLDVVRGTFRQTGDGAVTAARVYTDGVYDCRSSGTITALTTYGGRADFSRSEVQSVTITNATLTAGMLDLRSGLDNVTLSNNPTTTAGQVMADRGKAVNPKA